MEADAAGGVINLVMKNAPEKFKMEGNIGTGYSQLFFNRDFYSYSKSSIKLRSPSEISPGVFAPVAAFPYNNLSASLLPYHFCTFFNLFAFLFSNNRKNVTKHFK